MYKGYILAAVFAGSMVIGCATMPEKIEPSLLKEATADQTSQLDQINKDIMVKRDERTTADQALAVAEAMLVVSKEQIRVYDQNGKLFEAQSALYTTQNSKDKLEATAKAVDANNKKINQEKANYDYLTVYSDQLKVDKECRELELASLFAKADLIKAKIAFDYQTKLQEKKPIEVATYQKYADDTAKQLADKKADQKKAAEKTARAKDALVKTGYGAQQ